MRRKLVRQGNTTLMVSLPSNWVKANSLEKGDEVEIQESEGDVIISTEGHISNKEITIEANEDILAVLTHIYRSGYTKIIIVNPPSNISQLVNQFLLGFEITAQDNNKIIVENISEPSVEKYDVMIRRVFLIIKESISSLQEEKDIYDMKLQQDKLILYCKRLTKDVLQWELLTFLMHIEHALFYLNKFGDVKTIKSELVQLNNYYDLLYRAKFEKDITYIHKINALKNKYHFGEIQGTNITLSYLREVFRLIQITSSPILASLI